MAFQIGENVGRYRIVEQLGQGGMATVYKAYHAELDRYVALKVLHPAFLEEASFLARFQREARVVAKLEHPNIVPIYDYAEHEGRPYLVMKFIEGETLKVRLGRGSIDASEVVRIVEAVGAALSYAHRRGILHRDIKPSNVLLGKDGQIYLADFGLARIAQSGESTLTSDMIVGTPQYISPEQAMGKKDLDEGTDIYSFGVMLYELIVGRVPFNADTPFSIIHDHIYSPLPLPSQLNVDIPPEVERVLLKALAKERSDRYRDVDALVTAFLEAWKEGSPIAARPPAPEATTPVPVSEPTPTAVQTAPAARPAEAPPSAASAPPPPASAETVTAALAAARVRKVPWMWIAVAVLVFLCCLVTFLALRGNRQAVPGRGLSTPVFQEGLSPLATSEVAELLATAVGRVEQNPDDPYAHLQLATVYLEAGKPERAEETLNQALEVGGQNEPFLWDACREMEIRQTWLLAARACVQGAEVHREVSIDLSPDLKTLLFSTLYRAAPDPALEEFLPIGRLLLLDEMIAHVVKARHQLYAGDPNGALQTLESALQRWPDRPEVQLVEAEFLVRTDNAGQAFQVLDELQNRPDVPEWILQEVRHIRETIP